ncbi:ANK_REP_REGION domain-containing protein [Caenorhabditis elegans]|uniref:ANK_REP_REGION domain-containing protein n=1 Tax=Caenorhabditis elegans TaxID=6239 RepID=A0A2K5AU00_CAEEL|nr:ANK_REP_REGION domain-containing protein [Caenorhabditis elegans]SPC48654.1 ANK_REP_REGION domain-containing protein [Caenorhabditis elegans]|eukprot:NP_001348793.1 Uncharacterized protein CELE_C14A11.6 [Caenorhabditis elegans]
MEIMEEFVKSEIAKISSEHEIILTGWKNVNFTDENIKHLYNLFKTCSHLEIRIFERNNFLENSERNDTMELMTRKLIRVSNNQSHQSTSTIQKSPAINFDKTHSDFKESQEDSPTMQFLAETTNVVVEKALSKSTGLHDASEEAGLRRTKKKKKKSSKKLPNSISNLENSVEQTSKDIECNQVGALETIKKDEKFEEKDQIVDCQTRNSKKDLEESEDIESSTHYIYPESRNLKSNLQKLTTDISTEEKQIRERLKLGELANVDNGVLEEFISRANAVLKETGAVTMRKTAEAETNKYLTTNKVATVDSMGTISNELLQDIWPKTNKWRRVARVEDNIEDSEGSKKLDKEVEREVRAAIKSAGQSLSKKQIGQIRKAAVAYLSFEDSVQKELEFRSNNTLKLVQLVSAYEASNKMDELMLLRLAIAFCTKRRDFFLEARPPNFMQFTYMYIYLLEKINSRTALICACLNNQIRNADNFNELEELMLNLFHEDYFLEKN